MTFFAYANYNLGKKYAFTEKAFIDTSTYKHFLILTGEKIEAIIAYESIFKLAKNSIHIIDEKDAYIPLINKILENEEYYLK